MNSLFSESTLNSFNRRQQLAMITILKKICNQSQNSYKKQLQEQIVKKYMTIFNVNDIMLSNYELYSVRIDLRSFQKHQKECFIALGYELLAAIQDRTLEDFNFVLNTYKEHCNIPSSEFSSTIERLRNTSY